MSDSTSNTLPPQSDSTPSPEDIVAAHKAELERLVAAGQTATAFAFVIDQLKAHEESDLVVFRGLAAMLQPITNWISTSIQGISQQFAMERPPAEIIGKIVQQVVATKAVLEGMVEGVQGADAEKLQEVHKNISILGALIEELRDQYSDRLDAAQKELHSMSNTANAIGDVTQCGEKFMRLVATPQGTMVERIAVDKDGNETRVPIEVMKP